jgi:hypothetical protein
MGTSVLPAGDVDGNGVPDLFVSVSLVLAFGSLSVCFFLVSGLQWWWFCLALLLVFVGSRGLGGWAWALAVARILLNYIFWGVSG